MTDPVSLSALHPYYKTADGTDRHTRYYDTVFAKILAGQIWQANFVSAFFPLPWMLYRRLYLAGFIYNLVISLILSTLPRAYIVMVIPVNILVMLFAGNMIYYRALIQKINKQNTKAPSQSTDQQTCILYFLTAILTSLLAHRQTVLAFGAEILFWTWVYLDKRR